jgi:hypothetical protein
LLALTLNMPAFIARIARLIVLSSSD